MLVNILHVFFGLGFFFFSSQAFRGVLVSFSMNASNKYFYPIHLPTYLLFMLLLKTISHETSVAERVQKLSHCRYSRSFFTLAQEFSVTLLHIFEEVRNCKVLILIKATETVQPRTCSNRWTCTYFLFLLRNADVVPKQNCLYFYFLKASGGAAVPHSLLRLRGGRGTNRAGGWLCGKFCLENWNGE